MPQRRTVLVVSDVHLGAVPPERERQFLRWLEEVAAPAAELIINGDLFDFWFEYRSVVPRGHTRVLGALAALVDSGLPVRLMGGNHDWWGGSVLEEEIGLTLHKDPLVLDLAGRKVFLGHGDGLGSGDLGYRLLRLLLRGAVTRTAFRWLHPDVGAWLARRVSVTEQRAGVLAENEKRRAEALEAWAVGELERRPELDLVVLGHTHVPRLREVARGRYYVNTGDWVHHRTWLALEAGEPPRLEQWRDQADEG